MPVHYYSHSSRYTQCQALIISSLLPFQFLIRFFLSFELFFFFSVPICLPFSYDTFFSDQRDQQIRIRIFPTTSITESFPFPGSQFDTVHRPGFTSLPVISSPCIGGLVPVVQFLSFWHFESPVSLNFFGIGLHVVYLTLSSFILLRLLPLAPVSRVGAFPMH